MAVPAVHVTSEVQEEGVLVKWEADVLFQTSSAEYEYDIQKAWVVQDIMHADMTPTVINDVQQTYAVVHPPRCEWSAFVVYKIATTTLLPERTVRSRLSEPSVPIYVSCGPACKCSCCTRTPSVTFQRHGGSWFSRRL